MSIGAGDPNSGALMPVQQAHFERSHLSSPILGVYVVISLATSPQLYGPRLLFQSNQRVPASRSHYVAPVPFTTQGFIPTRTSVMPTLPRYFLCTAPTSSTLPRYQQGCNSLWYLCVSMNSSCVCVYVHMDVWCTRMCVNRCRGQMSTQVHPGTCQVGWLAGEAQVSCTCFPSTGVASMT